MSVPELSERLGPELTELQKLLVKSLVGVAGIPGSVRRRAGPAPAMSAATGAGEEARGGRTRRHPPRPPSKGARGQPLVETFLAASGVHVPHGPRGAGAGGRARLCRCQTGPGGGREKGSFRWVWPSRCARIWARKRVGALVHEQPMQLFRFHFFRFRFPSSYPC